VVIPQGAGLSCTYVCDPQGAKERMCRRQRVSLERWLVPNRILYKMRVCWHKEEANILEGSRVRGDSWHVPRTRFSRIGALKASLSFCPQLWFIHSVSSLQSSCQASKSSIFFCFFAMLCDSSLFDCLQNYLWVPEPCRLEYQSILLPLSPLTTNCEITFCIIPCHHRIIKSQAHFSKNEELTKRK
jgi:hypothetical protein